MSRTKVITANLTVFREADGTLHLPNGSLLPIDLSSIGAKDLFYDSILKTVLLKHVGNAVVEQSTYSAGAFAATKIVSLEDNSFVYVKEAVNDVYALQNPCCLKANTSLPLPSCPVVTATPAQTSVELNWSADPKATLGYRVIWYSGTLQNNTVIQDNTVNHGGAYNETKTGLTANTQYYFKVSPLDPNGSTDVFGDPLTISCSMQPVTTTA